MKTDPFFWDILRSPGELTAWAVQADWMEENAGDDPATPAAAFWLRWASRRNSNPLPSPSGKSVTWWWDPRASVPSDLPGDDAPRHLLPGQLYWRMPNKSQSYAGYRLRRFRQRRDAMFSLYRACLVADLPRRTPAGVSNESNAGG